MAGKRSPGRQAGQSKDTGCLSGCLSAIFRPIEALINALAAIRVTLPIGKGYQVSGLLIVLFLCSLCMCCSIGYVWADTQLRAIGVLPTYTPRPIATNTPIPTVISTLTGTPTPIDTPTPETVVTIDGYDSASDSIIEQINLWKDYNDRAAGVAAVARHGEKVKLIQRSGDGVLVETQDGKRGWVTYYFIKEFKPAPPETPLPTDTFAPSQPTAKVTAPTLNVRAGPDTSYPLVGKLSQDDMAEVVGRNTAGDWLQIVYPVDSDGRAWIATAYVELTSSLIEVPEVAAPPPPEPTPLPTNTPIPPADTPTMAPMPMDTPPPAVECPYIGNSNTGKFHHFSCPSVDDIKEEHKVCLQSREEAIDKGYEPCGNCNP